ncbi:MAG: H(+)/Cl(-) exchange transporter ClcA [Syntrophorhabdus sp. PtaU1.Bin050]|nr:MAG: H(+)/Cl(-) exchange transporter ClcA [Syntrophorhabdus sp. PtaU1.Bin050]
MAARIPEPFAPRRIKRIWRGTLLGILIGVVSGLGGILFNYMIKVGTQFFTQDLIAYLLPDHPAGFSFLGFPLNRWVMVWIPAFGGFLSGFLVFRFAPEAEGHGTDAMIDSFHRKKGVVRKQVPVIKAIASAITIGSGGSAGKEGPIAQIGSGFGSILASVLKLSDKERRIMLLAGAAGGIGAIFKAPLGAALFAAEVLYSKADFEFEAIIPCILSSIVGFMVFTLHDGTGTIFQIPAFALATLGQLPFYGVLGLLCALVGYLYVEVFYGMRDRFFKPLNIPRSIKPALGGLMLGLVAFFLPEVLGGGYGWIQNAIDCQLAMGLMAALVLGKILSTSFTISSGGSGGVFAPSLFIGSMLGGFYGQACGRMFPHIITEPAAFVLVGMGGFFAGVAKTPIAALIMVAEMTGGYSLILPMMVVSALAYLLLGKVSLYEKQVATRFDSPAHVGDYSVDIMDRLFVRDAVMRDRKVETIPEGMVFEDMLKRMVGSNQQDFPVVDKKGDLAGVISMKDLRTAMADVSLHRLLVAKDIAVTGVVAVTMNDSLNTALKLMAVVDVRELPVVDKEDVGKIVSIVSRKDITRAYHETMMRGAAGGRRIGEGRG